LRRSEKNKIPRVPVAAVEDDQRSDAERAAARQEWGAVRKAAREAFLAQKDWVGILNAFKDREGFYTELERAKFCKDYTEELINNALR
jgi:hypothetical protein